jgi:transcriptional regulator with XRE-family HTH domain
LWRLSEGLTQTEAARRLGMSHLTLGYLESCRLAPNDRDLGRLREVFGTDAVRMFERVDHDVAEVAR